MRSVGLCTSCCPVIIPVLVTATVLLVCDLQLDINWIHVLTELYSVLMFLSCSSIKYHLRCGQCHCTACALSHFPQYCSSSYCYHSKVKVCECGMLTDQYFFVCLFVCLFFCISAVYRLFIHFINILTILTENSSFNFKQQVISLIFIQICK